MDTPIDLLQIKIEKAKTELSEESRQAIDAVDWKTIILNMRAEKGYSFTQLEDLEIETELLLCGLLNPEDYPKELEKRMGIPKPKVDELVNEMNKKVFERIREELVKNIERKKVSEEKGQPLENSSKTLLDNGKSLESREELLEKIENPESINNYELRITNEKKPITNDQLRITNLENQSILGQKLSGTFQIPKTETDHSITNLSKDTKPKIPQADPYREVPE